VSRRLRTVAILAITACIGACRAERAVNVPPLPDLGAMAAPVQQQIREQYAQLTNGTAPASDRARAGELGTMGVLLMAAESVSAAEPFLTQAMALDPGEPRWPYYLGHLSRMKGDAEGAATHFQQVLTLKPDDVPSLIWLANVTLDQGRADAAAGLYERALALHPGLFDALFGLGRAALVGGKADLAVTRLEAASAAEPRATAVNYPLAMAYRQVGRVNDAETRLRARGDAQPPLPDPLMRELAEILRSPVVYESRGDRALAAGQPAPAVDAFRQALALAPERRAIKQKLATALALTGDVRAVTRDEMMQIVEGHGALARRRVRERERDRPEVKVDPAVRVAPVLPEAVLGEIGRERGAEAHAVAAFASEVRRFLGFCDSSHPGDSFEHGH